MLILQHGLRAPKFPRRKKINSNSDQPSAYAAIKINANDHWLHFSNYLLDSNVNAVSVRRRIFCLPRDTSTHQRQTYQVPKAVIVSPFSEIVWNFERWWYGGWANLHTNAIRLHSSHIMCNVVTTLNAGKHVNYIFVCACVSLCAMRMWWAASAICFNEKKNMFDHLCNRTLFFFNSTALIERNIIIALMMVIVTVIVIIKRP